MKKKETGFITVYKKGDVIKSLKQGIFWAIVCLFFLAFLVVLVFSPFYTDTKEEIEDFFGFSSLGLGIFVFLLVCGLFWICRDEYKEYKDKKADRKELEELVLRLFMSAKNLLVKTATGLDVIKVTSSNPNEVISDDMHEVAAFDLEIHKELIEEEMDRLNKKMVELSDEDLELIQRYGRLYRLFRS